MLSDGWMDGQMDRWWVDRRETLVLHYDRRESHDTICLAFFLRVPDMPIVQLNPLRNDAGQLVASI